MQMGATTFGMEGGEPFVKKNWEEIVKAWYPQYNHIIVSTNGYMLDEKLIKKCAAIGIDTFNISLDSGIEELHDVFRNKTGSFKKVMTAIKISEKYGVKIVLNTVVHKGNLYTEGLRKILAFGEKEKIMVNILFGKGVGAFKDKDVMMTKVEFEDFQKIAKGYNYWSIHHDGVLQANHGGQGCPGVREMFNLTPYGDVMNCANNHIYMGNVRENSLEKIRDYALKESPFGVRRPCFLTMDQDFMNIYYPLLEAKGSVSLKEFRQALRDYEKKHNKKVYSELS
jgi:MoaA/NifB/PqqE/SkfB family radical SAM enzyme